MSTFILATQPAHQTTTTGATPPPPPLTDNTDFSYDFCQQETDHRIYVNKKKRKKKNLPWSYTFTHKVTVNEPPPPTDKHTHVSHMHHSAHTTYAPRSTCICSVLCIIICSAHMIDSGYVAYIPCTRRSSFMTEYVCVIHVIFLHCHLNEFTLL